MNPKQTFWKSGNRHCFIRRACRHHHYNNKRPFRNRIAEVRKGRGRYDVLFHIERDADAGRRIPFRMDSMAFTRLFTGRARTLFYDALEGLAVGNTAGNRSLCGRVRHILVGRCGRDCRSGIQSFFLTDQPCILPAGSRDRGTGIAGICIGTPAAKRGE